MDAEIAQFRAALERGGLVAGLRVLSERTAFRYTGIYRYGPTGGEAHCQMLENVALIDRHDPSVISGPGVLLSDAYCDYLGTHGVNGGDELEFGDIERFALVPKKANNPARSYCGVVIRDTEGKGIGSLCYYDTRPCEPRSGDLPLLRAAARLLAPIIA